MTISGDERQRIPALIPSEPLEREGGDRFRGVDPIVPPTCLCRPGKVEEGSFVGDS